MEARIRDLRRQLAVYQRALKGIENVDLWELYSQKLMVADAELRQLTSTEGAAFYAKNVAAFRAHLPLTADQCSVDPIATTGWSHHWESCHAFQDQCGRIFSI